MAEVTAMRNVCTPYPLYGLPWVVVAPLLDADGDPVSPSSPDSEISKNGDTFADCTNEATEIATSSGVVYLSLTGTELTTDIATIRIQSTGAKTTVLTLLPRKLVSIRAGTSASGGVSTSTIVLDGSASAVDDFYNGMIVAAVIDSVTEVRMITDYTGSTQTATVTPDWNTAPDNNDTFTIYLPDGVQIQQANATHIAGSAVSTSSAQIGVNVVNAGGTAWGSGAITAASIASDAITAAKIADGAIDAATFAAGAITAAAIAADAITDAKVASDVTIASVTGAVGSVTGSVGSVVATVSADVVSISGDTAAADNAESYFDGTGYGEVLQRTTIATLASQTSFTLTAGSADNDAYNDCVIVIQDAATAAQKAVAVIDDYTGSTKTVTLRTDPAVFAMATSDIVTILADRSLKPTVMNRTLDVTAGGCAGLDWANVEAPTTTLALTGTTIATTQQVDVNTIKTQSVTCSAGVTVGAFVGQATAAISVNGSGHVSRVTLVDTVTTLTGHTAQTGDSYARIGAAGAGLTDLGGMSTTMKAQVQTEAEEALQTYHLDHFIASADPGSVVANSSFLAKLTSKSATPAFTSYDNTTDSLEALRDRGDAAWITATGFSTLTAADVRTAVGLASANLDTQLTAIDDYIDSEVSAIKTVTDRLSGMLELDGAVYRYTTNALEQSPTGSGGFTSDDRTTLEAIPTFSEIWTTALTEAYASDGAAFTPAQGLFMIWSALTEFAVSGTTISAKRLDGSTVAMTFTMDSSTAPTSRTRSS